MKVYSAKKGFCSKFKTFHSLYYKTILSTILSCFFVLASHAQSTLSVQNYLKNRVGELVNFRESSEQHKSFTPAWIDGIDFRTETNQFDVDRQRYTFRLSPNTPKLRKAQANLHQLYLKKATLQNTLLKKDFIEIACEEVLDFYEAFQTLSIKEELLIVLEDQEKVWRKLSQRTTGFPKEWLAIQEDIGQLQVEIFREEEALKIWQADGIWLNWDDLLAAGSLIEKIQRNEAGKFHLQAKEYDIDNLIVEREEELEYAEQKKILDFIQVEYRGPHDDIFEEKISLTAAFRLPFSSNRQLKMEEIAIEKEVLQQERLAEKQLSIYKEKELRNRINLLTQELIFMQEKANKQASLLLNLATKQSNREGGNPLLLLYQKENRLKSALDILDLEMDIYQEYLDYLKLTEQLYQPDFYRWFSKIDG